MKLNRDFITHYSDGKLVMVSLDRKKFSGIVRLNESGAFIVDLLKEDISRDGIVDEMVKEYDVDRDLAGKDADRVIKVLNDIGALDD